MRRLAIHPTVTAGKEVPEAVDLTLPADSPIAVLIPPIVDVVLNGSATAAAPLRWHLARIGGRPLDTSMTLRENDVHDGDLILLTADPGPLPRSRPGDASAIVAEVANPLPTQWPGAFTVSGIAVTIVSAAALAATGLAAGSTMHLWTAATLSAAGATSAVLIGRPAHRMSLVVSVAAVSFAMVTGFLAVPDASWAPKLLLTATPAFAVSILLLHMARRAPTVLASFAAATCALAATGAIGMSAELSFRALGATLTVLSLAALSGAPKLTVAFAGLGPSQPEIGNQRAEAGHRILTGLVAGWSLSTTLGVVAVAADAGAGIVPPAIAAIFAADIGLLLLLRTGTHVDARRRAVLGVAGLCSLTAAFIVTVSATPAYASWPCAAAAAAGMVLGCREGSFEPPNPLVRNLFQMVEYLALATVVPLAAWVAGVYVLVRGLSLV